jgi:hypothetical protein
MVGDREAAATKLHRLLGGTIGTAGQSTFLDLGPAALELRAAPDDGFGAEWHQRNGNGAFTICFVVDDLDQAATFLGGAGVGCDESVPGTLVVNPADAFGVAYEFTSRPVAEVLDWQPA